MLTVWFDDGLESVYTVAYPIMKQYGLTGIVGVITSKVGKTQVLDRKRYNCMTIEQLKDLVFNGWEIASHSVTHPQPYPDGWEFCGLPLEQTEYELKKAKEWIQQNLGVVPTKFVVPRHFLTREQMELARKYYKFVRSFPLGFPEGHVVFHHVESEGWFKKRLKRFGIIE